jgi:hypothetical protein
MVGLKKRNTQLAAAGITLAVWLGVGTVVFHQLESWTWVQSLYFSTTTLTTIGYGDLHPTTDASRLVDVVYMIFGVITVLSAFTIIGTTRLEERAKKIEQHRKKNSKQ